MAQPNLPQVIVLALGVPVVGAPGAVARLRDAAGQNPAADVAITVFIIGAGTSFVLGTMLLARYVGVAPAANDGATARFARVTLAVALAVAVFVAACLIAVP